MNIIRPAARSLLCAGVCALAALSGTAHAQYQLGRGVANGSSTDSTYLGRGTITVAPYNATFTPGGDSGAAGDSGNVGCSRVTNAGGCGGAGGASGGSSGAGSGSGSGGNG